MTRRSGKIWKAWAASNKALQRSGLVTADFGVPIRAAQVGRAKEERRARWNLLRFSVLLAWLLLTTTPLWAEPRLSISRHLDRESVPTGEELVGHLQLTNVGNEPLHIRGVQTSCGCTTLRLKQRRIAPGDSVQLDFVVDTRGKLGRIEKTITLHTNEPDSPHVVTVVFHALPSGMAGADTQAVFQPPCASCHLDPGIGQHSAALFAAVCAMCHPDGVKIREPDALAHWITEGNAHTGMPGFQDRLTGAQVQSLVTLLKQ